MAQQSLIEDAGVNSLLTGKQRKALSILNGLDTTSPSSLWPNLSPDLFFSNIRKNIEHPESINQGQQTNFCGYAALTHLLLKYQPDVYVQSIYTLYRKGALVVNRKSIKPSEAVRNAAGTLRRKGELDMLHANQMWFLSLADAFKGYMNIVDHHYQPGDENKIWAGTNLAKFNKMVKVFTQRKLELTGSDFIRPWKDDYYAYLKQQLQEGVVMLFVNSKYLYPHKHNVLKLRAPTHFIVLYDLNKINDVLDFKYWDYGMKTEQFITRKRLKRLIFGITTITKYNEEEKL